MEMPSVYRPEHGSGGGGGPSQRVGVDGLPGADGVADAISPTGCTNLGVGTEPSFRENYAYCLDEAIKREELKRDAKWTESLAVGSEDYVKKVGLGIKRRVRVESKERTVGQADVREGWTRERRPAQPSGMVAKVA